MNLVIVYSHIVVGVSTRGGYRSRWKARLQVSSPTRPGSGELHSLRLGRKAPP